MLRVIVADDHPMVLLGVEELLHAHRGTFLVVGKARNGRELIILLRERACDLLITDFTMPSEDPDGDGLAMLSNIHEQWPVLPILVLTMVRDPTLIVGMFAAGVLGVLDKATSSQDLMIAIATVMNGQRYRGYVRISGESMDTAGGKEAVVLSMREAEVVRLWAQGMSVSEIARRTGRRVTTISRQKRTAMERLGASTDRQLLEYARTSGLFLP